MNATVELDIFSGFPNPSYTIHDAEARRFLTLFDHLPAEPLGFHPIPSYDEPLGRPRSGYRGITITFENGKADRSIDVFQDLVMDSKTGRVYRDRTRQLEKYLYSLFPAQVIDDALGGMTYLEVTTSGSESRIQDLGATPSGVECGSALPYEGDTGAFHTFRKVNNCYNYATNVVNKELFKQAIPGNPNVKNPLTAAKLDAALIDDGLTSLGTTLTERCPPAGSHYIAVLLRHSPAGDVRDFHCLRLGRDGTWSHKDGKGKVRDVDDSGDPIKDLATAVLSWSPTLVGFYQVDRAKSGLIG